MSEQYIDPLAQPAGELEEPKFPIAKPGPYRMKVISLVETESNEVSEKTGVKNKWMVLELATTTDAVSTDNEKLHPGHKVFARIMITPTEKRPLKRVAEECAMPIKAIFGGKCRETARQCLDNPALVVNKTVDVKLDVETDKNGKYPPKNVVKTWVIPAA